MYLWSTLSMQSAERSELKLDFLHKDPEQAVLWQTETSPVSYPYAIEFMENYATKIASKQAPEMVWLLEHPALYTAGSSAKEKDLLQPHSLPVYKTARGGQYTYHGPGQRIAYIMLDLQQRCCDIRRFVAVLEELVIRSLAQFGITGERREDRVGVWVSTAQGEKKIAALGIKIRKWVSFHGIAINLNPELEHYSGIIPCGLPDFAVTSFSKLAVPATMPQLDNVLAQQFVELFGPIKIL